MRHISTKCRLFLFLCGVASAGGLREPEHDGPLLASLDRLFRMEYAAAESLLAGLPEEAPAKPYFLGLVALNRFQDLGDTAALRRAQRYWEFLSAHPSPKAFQDAGGQLRVYRGLAALQLSYVAKLRGSSWHSASLALAARRQLLPAAGRFAEAEAGLAVFDYYRERFLESWVPFSRSGGGGAMDRLQAAAAGSRYLRDLLNISVFWMRVDRNENDSALKIARDFLRRYPDNRLARQMLGSALFRSGRAAEARTVFEGLHREYAALRDALPPEFLPLGAAAAAGNLTRIYGVLGMKTEAATRREEWEKARAGGLGPWLPQSLRKDLESREYP